MRYVDSWLLEGSFQFHHRGGRPSQLALGNFVLDAGDIAELRSVWATLTGGILRTKRFIEASLRRFSMAADRDQFEDLIVDLTIAAESLFLSDGRDQELAFRVALRAAHFTDWPEYSRRDIFDLASEVYKTRSKLVHGGSMRKSLALPRRRGAPPDEFRETVEQMLRRAIRKALREAIDVPDFGSREYWLRLLLPPAAR